MPSAGWRLSKRCWNHPLQTPSGHSCKSTRSKLWIPRRNEALMQNGGRILSCDLRYPTNFEVSSRLDLWLREVVHLDKEPLPVQPLAGHVDLDDAPNHIGRDREIGGDALGRRRRHIALDRDCGFPFRR